MKRLNTEEFIEKSKMLHGDIYGYELTNYINSHTKVLIKCKIHGTFEQIPNNHLTGKGCIKCSGKEKLSTSDFIKKAVNIHGLKYDYDRVNYKSNNIKVEIKCDAHGIFLQEPSNHLMGYGCLKCGGNFKSDTSNFINKSNVKHNFLFNYDMVNYINAKTKVKIKCLKHGIFGQVPNKHLSGDGCPFCEKSKGELLIKNLLETYNINYKSQYSFPDLKNKRKLYFDFGILNNKGNLEYLLEYNGEQHYIYKKQFNMTEEEFLISQHRDKLKQDYCEKNNIPLYIIKYDEDINEKFNLFCTKNVCDEYMENFPSQEVS